MSILDVKTLQSPTNFDLTLDAQGSGKDIIFKSDGTQVASISDAGLLTATTFAGSGASLTALPAAQLTGSLPAISGASLTGLTSSQMPAGSVLQVIQFSATASRTIITSQNSWTSHFSLAITPSSTSSKILVHATVPAMVTGSSNLNRGGFRLQRGSTTIWNTDDFKEHLQFRNADSEGNSIQSVMYLDSPNTTSATTYDFQGNLMSGTGLYMFSKAEGSNMVLMEIAG